MLCTTHLKASTILKVGIDGNRLPSSRVEQEEAKLVGSWSHGVLSEKSWRGHGHPKKSRDWLRDLNLSIDGLQRAIYQSPANQNIPQAQAHDAGG